MEISNPFPAPNATFKMVGAALTVGMSANITVETDGTLYMTNGGPGAASSTLLATPAIPFGGSMSGKMTVNGGLLEVANQWLTTQPQRVSSVPIPIQALGYGQINVRYGNGLSVTGNPSMPFAIDLQGASSAAVGLPMPSETAVGRATLAAFGRDTHVASQAALHFFGEGDHWRSETKASIDGVLDLGFLPGTTWHTTVTVDNGSVWFNSTSHFLFWGSGSDQSFDFMWNLDSGATIEIFSGAVALPQVVPGTSAGSFTWNDVLEASNIDGNFAVDPAAGSGWRFFGSGAPGSGPHTPDWRFNTVSWNVAFNA
jgi:hypothetical protein